MLAFALAALVQLAPIPEGSAALLARSPVKSEDGKHALQLATFGFPMSESDRKLLLSIMNSDPYLHHFRPRAVFLTVGGKTYRGGPRVVGWHPWVALIGKAPPRWPWTCSFVLPADVGLAGKLTFHYRNPRTADDEPAAESFAKLELSRADVKAMTVPFRATVTATGTRVRAHADTGVLDAEASFVAFVLNHTPHYADMTVGDARPAAHPVRLFRRSIEAVPRHRRVRIGPDLQGSSAGRGRGAGEVPRPRRLVQGRDGLREAEGEEVSVTRPIR
jgi:hypothetical protein